jgi:hypothetical protein
MAAVQVTLTRLSGLICLLLGGAAIAFDLVANIVCRAVSQDWNMPWNDGSLCQAITQGSIVAAIVAFAIALLAFGVWILLGERG